MNEHIFYRFFLSNDDGLRYLLNEFKVKGVIYNKNRSDFIPFGKLNGTDFFKSIQSESDIEVLFSDSEVSRRKEILHKNRATNYSVINDEFKQLKDIMQCS